MNLVDLIVASDAGFAGVVGLLMIGGVGVYLLAKRLVVRWIRHRRTRAVLREVDDRSRLRVVHRTPRAQTHPEARHPARHLTRPESQSRYSESCYETTGLSKPFGDVA
jgi:hypothetical protein